MSDPPAGGGFAGRFATPTLVSLLGLSPTRRDGDFYQPELAGLTGSRLVPVQRDLRRLESAGLVARRRHDPRQIATLLAEAGAQFGREVNVAACAADGLRASVAAGTPFPAGVLDGARIWPLGGDAELGALLRSVGPAGG